MGEGTSFNDHGEKDMNETVSLRVDGVDGPFKVDDIVRTKKGARYWGKVTACYAVLVPKFHEGYKEVESESSQEKMGERVKIEVIEWKTEWRVDVMAVDPGFMGTMHIYPSEQLELYVLPVNEWDKLAHDAVGGALINAYQWMKKVNGAATIDTVDPWNKIAEIMATTERALKNMEEVSEALIERWTKLREAMK